MPLQNRVDPQSAIKRSSARGTLMGNRGVLHNSEREVTRQFKTKAWITCQLEFKGRQRQLMSPGSYTELFFLDEVTAFAAGHRPCAECRRARYVEFRDAWQAANEWEGEKNVRAPELDKMLHEQRMQGSAKVTWRARFKNLPHGTMLLVNDEPHAVYGDRLLAWHFDGYQEANLENLPEEVEVLTPHSVVRTFSDGFRPEFHPSILE